MQRDAKRNLVLTTVSSFNLLGGTYQTVEPEKLYQHIAFALMKGAYNNHLEDVGNELTTMADHAVGLRQADAAERISEILMKAPLPHEYHKIGQYYRALSVKRRDGVSAANSILERIASSPATPLRYRARALQAIGGNYFDNGNTIEGLRFFLEAGHLALPKHGDDLLTTTLSRWMIAVIRSMNGDHKGALEDLEKLSPFVRLIVPDHPHYYFTYANALAVELLELGHIEEAQNASRIALAFPFADKYPEFSDTAKDLSQQARRASRSVVAINKQVLQDEEPSKGQTTDEQNDQITAEQTGAQGKKLLLFRSRIYKPQEPLYSPIEAKQSQLSPAQKRSLLNDISGNLPEEAFDRLLAFARELDTQSSTARRPREINLEEKSTMEQLLTLWVNGDLGPDDFAAVMSALRDCDNDLRRKTIIDQMISYSFYFTRDRMEGEDFWRKRVEARLTPEPDAG
jgi:tetratricopeptide (TPR) repeat protein